MPRSRHFAAALLLVLCSAGASPAVTGVRPNGLSREGPAFVSERQGETHPVRTRSVLDRWLKAIGGRARLDSVHSMYVKAVVVSNGQIGTLENWQAADGRYKTIVSLGDHEFTTVCDGSSGWAERDGEVEDLQGTALAAAITRSYLGSYSQFFTGRRSGSVEWVREDPDAYVIRLLPLGGIPLDFHLDKNTGLPVRHEMVDGDRTLTFYYLEWKDYAGLKVMQRGRQTSGSDAPDLTVTTQDITWNPSVDPKLFHKPAP